MFENAVTSTPSPASNRQAPPCRGSICRTRSGLSVASASSRMLKSSGFRSPACRASCKCCTVFSGPLVSYIRFSSRYLIALTIEFS